MAERVATVVALRPLVVQDVTEELHIRYEYVPRGLASFSHHGVYLPWVPDYSSVEGRWHRLMNTLPSLMGAGATVREMADSFDLPYLEVHDYLQKWAGKGLARVRISD